MGTDIRKPVTHRFGIERANQLSSASTSDENFDSDDESEAEDATSKAVVPRSNRGTNGSTNGANGTQNSTTNGGGGNIMDQEERVAADIGDDEPLYDSEDDDDADGNSARRPPGKSIPQAIIKGLTSAGSKLKSAFHRTTPPSNNTGSLTPFAGVGAPTYKTFKAPPGKRIFVPVRVEPKVFFAAERTFLSWFEFSIYLGAISALLLNFGVDSAEHKGKVRIALYSAWGFTAAAVVSLVYALGMYLWRIEKIKKRRAVRYHDKWGPTVLCGMLLVSVALNVGFNIAKGITGK